MYLLLEVVVLCLVFWLLCFLGTGGDKKNIKAYATYPDKVQEIVAEREDLKGMIRVQPWYIGFISTIVEFVILLFIFGVFLRGETFLYNFVLILILGESVNLFDFVIMDLCWWRHTRRVRFSGTEDQPELYKPIAKHFYAFLRGVVAFAIVACIDGGLLMLF